MDKCDVHHTVQVTVGEIYPEYQEIEEKAMPIRDNEVIENLDSGWDPEPGDRVQIEELIKQCPSLATLLLRYDDELHSL